MDKYDQSLVPAAFGLNNTGVICYFNGFLQALAGCSSFTKTVIGNKEYLHRTNTGTAVYKFVAAYVARVSVQGAAAQNIEHFSEIVLRALMTDLAKRRPHVRFGGGQESASEALIHLLDMIEPQDDMQTSPITNLFLHRFKCDLYCYGCKKIISSTTDYAVNFNLFHIDDVFTPNASKSKNITDFSKAVRFHSSITEDYKCLCKSTKAIRFYSLTMIPEIIFCMFNLYGNVRNIRYFPEHIEFPAIESEKKLLYRLIGQIEHTGSLSGGHYWARGLRADNQVYLLNDTGVSISKFTPTINTYIIVYNYENTI